MLLKIKYDILSDLSTQTCLEMDAILIWYFGSRIIEESR